MKAIGRFHLSILAIWLIAVAYCMAIPLRFQEYIPDTFGDVTTQVFETFAPSLTTMLAFAFTKRRNRRARSEPTSTDVALGVVAVFASLAYCGVFVWCMWRFSEGGLPALELIPRIALLRSRTNFLVTALMAYYFSSK
jgi:hypothetical protein